MRGLLVKYLKWLLFKFEPKVSKRAVEISFTDEEWPAYLRAVELTLQNEQLMENQSGEFKRHQAYLVLVHEFPQISKRKLGLAIEVALNQ